MGDKKLDNIVVGLGKKFSDVTIVMHEVIARHAGLSGTDHKYLSLLSDAKQLTAGELSKRSGLTTGAVTGVIDRLERQGFVRREFVKNDRRKVVIVADEEAIAQVLGHSADLLKNKIMKLVKSFSDSERVIIEKYLSDAIGVMEQVTAELSENSAK